MSEWEPEWNDEIDDPQNLLEGIKGHEGIEKEFQCRVCLNMFAEREELMLHIIIHTEQFALDFIKKYQPVSGKMILKKFKNLDLLELEGRKLIKFSDESMGWCLQDFVVKDYTIKKNEIRFNSIINSPCLTCQYEKVCEITNKKINPINCLLINDWVNDKIIPKNDNMLRSENHIETLIQAKFWCTKSKKFDIIGILGKNKIQNSPNKFILTDNEGDEMPIILKSVDKKMIELLGKNIILKNVKLTEKVIGFAIDAALNDSVIEVV